MNNNISHLRTAVADRSMVSGRDAHFAFDDFRSAGHHLRRRQRRRSSGDTVDLDIVRRRPVFVLAAGRTKDSVVGNDLSTVSSRHQRMNRRVEIPVVVVVRRVRQTPRKQFALGDEIQRRHHQPVGHRSRRIVVRASVVMTTADLTTRLTARRRRR